MNHQSTQNDERARAERLTRRFTALFGHEPHGVWRAPGRVNLIGEHTDYNAGYVLPLAVNRVVAFAGYTRTDQKVRIWSLHFQHQCAPWAC